MSLVTNIVLLFPREVDDETALTSLGLVKLHDYVGDTIRPGHHKGFESELWAGAFNYLDWDDFKATIERVEWGSKEDVQVLVEEQEESRFRLWQFDDAGVLVEIA